MKSIQRQPTESKHRVDKVGFQYLQKRQLGRGAYSSAFLYQRTGQLLPNPFNNFFYDKQLASQRYCVLKYYAENFQQNLGLDFSTLRQINLMLTSNHPNIVCAHQVFFKRQKVQLIMDLFLDLAIVIHNQKISNNFLQKKKICYHITKGLAHLHENYILHRDLKPQNIFVSRDGICKIGDFGMSKQFGTPGRKCTPGVCTAQYRAPELFLVTNYYTEKVDIWSLGCIFYYIFAGHHLFNATHNDLSMIIDIFTITGTPDEKNWKGYLQMPKIYLFDPYPKKKLSQYKGLSQEVGELIQLCINIDPKKRVSAKQLLKSPFFSQFSSQEDLPTLDIAEIYDLKLEQLLKNT